MRPSTALQELSFFVIASLSMTLLFLFVELGDHEVVESVCVPRSHESCKNPPPDAHETTKVSEDVKEVVSRARVGQVI